MSRPRVVVIGLGPAGVDLLLPAARAALQRIPVRYVRTARHPAVDELAREGLVLEPLDLLYDTGDDFDTVYAAIAARVVEAAQEHGEVAYAVPGSPSVAERTVTLLRGAGIDIEIVPGLSFADLAWNRLGIDPMTGARVVDARTFAVDSAGFAGAMLLAQCDTQFVLSDVKLALLEVLAPDHEVIVLQGLGLPTERLVPVALAELDHSGVEPDHLTSVFVDTGDVSVAGELARLLALTERLRGPGGCPWDAAQTHHSLRRHVLEEAYEVAAAIDALPADAPGGDIPAGAYDALEDELGDLLFQVMIHSVLASEAGAFTVADVARGVHTKLVRRHPHVFGDVAAETPDAVVTNWEQIKKDEKGHSSLVEGITPGLPALIYVQKLLRKAASVGLAPDLGPVPPVDDEAALGAALAALVVSGSARGLDGESALSAWAGRFRDRFTRMEQLAGREGVDLGASDESTVRAMWERVRDA